MPRLPRVHLENTLYYINMEGPSGEPIFRDADDHAKYLDILSEAKKEFSFKLFAYSLLPDSLQLLVEPTGEFPVSQVMQKVTPNYTKYYNAKYGRKGHLFAKRFRSVFVEKEHYLARLTRFVHYLPVRAGLATSPRDYAYTSYQAYTVATLQGALNIRAEVDEVLRSLPGRLPEDPFERFSLSVPEKELALFEKKLGRGSFLGSHDFVIRVKREIAEHIASKEDNLAPVAIKTSGTGLEVRNRPVPVNRVALLSGALVVTLGLSVFSFQMKTGSQNLSLSNFQPFGTKVESPVETSPTVGQKATDRRSPMIAKATPIEFDAPISGTIWDIQLYTVSPEGAMTPIKDKIKFDGKSFASHYFSTKGFSPSNYTVTVHDNGTITWETIQANASGEMISWHGDLQGNRLEGVMSYQTPDKSSQNYSFMSKQGNAQVVQHG